MATSTEPNLLHKEFWDLNYVSGPLVFLGNGDRFPTGAILDLVSEDGLARQGQVLEANKKYAIVQVLQGTQGIDIKRVSVSLKKEAARVGVSKELIGRTFNGTGDPIDGMPPVVADKEIDIIGTAINPVSRNKPNDFIETGLSTIDGFNTLVRG